MGRVRELVGDSHPASLARGYALNLILRSLDRLEVRGRDSAGLAAYVRFAATSALDAFLDRPCGGRAELESRTDPTLSHGAVIRPPSSSETLLFVFKVAEEVGKIGDNVAFLTSAIAEDRFFQSLLREPDVDIQCLAHTRWASNGVVSLPNCHPVDNTLLREGSPVPRTMGRFVACLNGDIDNYQELVRRYVESDGQELDRSITTAAKIAPVVVAHYYDQVGDLEESFRLAFDEFEESMAIGLMAAERNGDFLFAQKGSGQGLFFGLGNESVAVASEMYGVVELAPHYVKADGQRFAGGEVFRLRTEQRRVRFEVLGEGGFAAVPTARRREAEITTRDINRSDYRHFFAKEISESVDSVRSTLSGKFEVSESGQIRSLLGVDVLPVDLVAGLREGRVRQIGVVGQGTAAVAAQGVARLLDVALERSPHPVEVIASPATEFSAHRLRQDMSDTVLIAVSQSGTTTDTNRTVDLARQRGAWILAIVNRRNSDLVYKAHGVLYTSDGRDIEMSVASTKAFYAQNVAGQVLALGLADALGTLDDAEISRAVEDLRELPSIMERTLALGDEIAELAREYSLRRRYWAVVGSGAAKIAADEIRIKLSELCYKSIAVDYLEDKKHIDLSSEPLILVCSAGQRQALVSDAVKEVAIFKAHQAIPIVITEEGEESFDPYAAGVIRLPVYRGALGYLSTTLVGHLFGYHAAASMDSMADRLRSLRSEIVRRQSQNGAGEGTIPEFFPVLAGADIV